ncbi:MAG: hypothetical protein JXR88_01210 [Clostridia bacterium]|nr:hypothetical protein [Clostridia bacterium]
MFCIIIFLGDRDEREEKKIYKYLNDPEMVQRIIHEGDIQKICKKSKENALFFAVKEDVALEVLKMLLDAGIELNLQNKNGDSVIHLCENLEKLALILQYNPDLNLKNKQQRTPIFGCNDYGKAQMLVDAGVDLNVCDCEGKHFLKSLNTMDFDLMKIFIDRGMNRFMEKRGLTLDSFFESWCSLETYTYFEHKLKTEPNKYKVRNA